ncbi:MULTISPECIES: restriction endonuclease subunit S [unclassified Pseudoalteromonas]|uniref:restriction endonuclease subunit S n=1 Tax=unclassified Pseudoalteromonas TaxID=194690 RepID=UPI0009785259|nr:MULTISPECIES: restriction endonuclease subunit S [unclassified Pseudoalteromonas]MDN3489151.1 restriction endonuclease subunit S [Pseudoalteromonas sp. APC 3694]
MEWKRIKLGELCRIELGKTPSRSNKSYWDESKVNNNIWLSIADLPLSDKSIMLDSKEYISNAGAELCKIVPKGTLIVSFKLSLGRLAVTGRDLYTNEAIAALYIHDKQKIDQNYLSWYLTFFDWDAAAGSDIKVKGKTLNKAKLKEIEIVVPPIPEQKRIVAILDQVFADIEQARAKTEQNLKNARELFESYLQQVFSQRGGGWVESTLGEVTGGIYTGPFGSLLHKSDYIENGIPLVNPAHITALGIEVDNRKTVSKETAERLSSYIMEKGDVVIGRRGEMGRCALVTSQESGFLCGTGSFFIKSSSRCDSGYLVRYLRSASCVARLEKIAGGAVMPNLSNKDLSNFAILLPPIEKQIEILELIDILSEETEKVALTYQKKLDSLDELKKSILQKAFSGKLTKTLEVDTNKGAVA